MPVDISIAVEIPTYRQGEADELAQEIGLGEPIESGQQRLELITSVFDALEPKQSDAIRWYYPNCTRQDDWTSLRLPTEIVRYFYKLRSRKLFDEFEFRHTTIAGPTSWVLIGTHKSNRGTTHFVLARWGEHMPEIETIERGHRYYMDRVRDSDKLKAWEGWLWPAIVIVLFVGVLLGLTYSITICSLALVLALSLAAIIVYLNSKASRIRRTAGPQARRSCEPKRILG